MLSVSVVSQKEKKPECSKKCKKTNVQSQRDQIAIQYENLAEVMHKMTQAFATLQHTLDKCTGPMYTDRCPITSNYIVVPLKAAIDFANSIPAFLSISQQHRVYLLQNSVFDVMLLASAGAATSPASPKFPPGGIQYDPMNTNPSIPRIIQSISERIRLLPPQVLPILTAISVCQAELLPDCQQPILLADTLWHVLAKVGGLPAIWASPDLLKDIRLLRSWHNDRLRQATIAQHISPNLLLGIPAVPMMHQYQQPVIIPPAFLSPPASATSTSSSSNKSEFIERHQSIASLLERPRRISSGAQEPLNLSLPHARLQVKKEAVVEECPKKEAVSE